MKQDVVELARGRLRKATKAVHVEVSVFCASAAVDTFVAHAKRRSRACRAVLEELSEFVALAAQARPSRRAGVAGIRRCETFMLDEDDMQDFLVEPLQDNAFARSRWRTSASGKMLPTRRTGAC